MNPGRWHARQTSYLLHYLLSRHFATPFCHEQELMAAGHAQEEFYERLSREEGARGRRLTEASVWGC